MTVDQGLQALIIKSANDVAVMLAEAVAGSEVAFVANMNATARRLGMSRTVFVNPNGLPAPAQVTTARDLAKLARAIINDFPEYAHYWAKPEMRLGKNRLVTHNGLLRSFEGADGMKTGFTCDSGFNVIATASRDGRRVIAVVLGDASSGERNVRAASMLEFGFQQTGWKQLFNSTTIDNMPLATDWRWSRACATTCRRGDARNARRASPNPAPRRRRPWRKRPAEEAGPGRGCRRRETQHRDRRRVPETTGSTSPTVQLRGTMPPPAAASFAPQ